MNQIGGRPPLLALLLRWLPRAVLQLPFPASLPLCIIQLMSNPLAQGPAGQAAPGAQASLPWEELRSTLAAPPCLQLSGGAPL